MKSFSEQIAADGFAIVPSVLTSREVEGCIAALDAASVRVTRSSGIRNLVDEVPHLGDLSEHPNVRSLVAELLGPSARLIRSILFDKVPDANWSIRWHQDKTIAVAERRRVSGYGPWSVKAGVVSVQPPTQILEQVLTVRLHLDDCPAENGALQVIPGSHRFGKLSAEEASTLIGGEIYTCELPAGGALLMKPLLLHASPRSDSPAHRRVVHLDYAACQLDGGLRWASAACSSHCPGV